MVKLSIPCGDIASTMQVMSPDIIPINRPINIVVLKTFIRIIEIARVETIKIANEPSSER